MGLLIEGQWHDQWYNTQKSGGHFVRESAQFHNALGTVSFPAEPHRYHLYVSYACPWAHRTLIMRHLKGLEPLIGVTSVIPEMLEHGWVYNPPEPLYGHHYHHQLYTQHDPLYSGRVTVPVLWDTQQHCIVNNESSEIIRQFNQCFNALTENHEDYYPAALQKEIEQWNQRIYHAINNGVYRCGFATSQSAYEEAYQTLFSMLNQLEQHLSRHAYLTGDYLTEADIRLFTTLIRFDAVYFGHFKCNQKRLCDYPNLWDYTKSIYQFRDIAQTVQFDQIKTHYYYSHGQINPSRIVPLGPDLSDLQIPAKRPQAKVMC